jgi:hypothetical protein
MVLTANFLLTLSLPVFISSSRRTRKCVPVWTKSAAAVGAALLLCLAPAGAGNTHSPYKSKMAAVPAAKNGKVFRIFASSSLPWWGTPTGRDCGFSIPCVKTRRLKPVQLRWPQNLLGGLRKFPGNCVPPEMRSSQTIACQRNRWEKIFCEVHSQYIMAPVRGSKVWNCWGLRGKRPCAWK